MVMPNVEGNALSLTIKPLLQSTAFRITLIVVLGLLAYSNTFDVPFYFDDNPNIAENPLIKNLSGVPSLFAGGKGPFASRPLMHATNALNYYFGGLDPTGYHIVNLSLHLLNGILLYFLIVLTGRHLGHGEKDTGLVAALSALLFVVHPVQTEGVTCIISRSMLLASTFYFSGLILFLKAVISERRRGFYIAGLFFTTLLGAASRENFAMFPVMLVLYDLFFISGFKFKRVVKHYKAYLPVLISLGYLAHLVLNNTYDKSMEYPTKNIPALDYVLTEFNVHWTYLRLLVFPVNQNLDYDYTISRSLLELPTIVSFIGYAGLWAGGILFAKKRPVVSFGVLWFLVALVPISFAVAVMGLRLGDVIFEHRLYLPGAGIIVAFSTSAVAMIGRIRGERARTAAVLCMALLLIVFSASAYKRNAVWQSRVSRWSDVVRKLPNNIRAHNNLGNAYKNDGQVDRAIAHYVKALSIKPSVPVPYDYYAAIHYNLGAAYALKGLTGEAVTHYNTSLEFNPDNPDAYNNLGVIYFERGITDTAIRYYWVALEQNPSQVSAHYNLGDAYFEKGLTDMAIKHYVEFIRHRPDYAEAHLNLSLAYRKKGLEEKAREHSRIAENLRQKKI